MKYLLLILACIVFVFVANAKSWSEDNAAEQRFTIVYQQIDGLNDIQILLDKQTGVEYLLWKYGRSAAMIRLVEKSPSDPRGVKEPVIKEEKSSQQGAGKQAAEEKEEPY